MIEGTMLEEMPETGTASPPDPNPVDPVVSSQPARHEGFSGKPGDAMKDLAFLAKQQGIELPQSAQQPAQPAQPQAAVTPEPVQPQEPNPAVPDKFKNPDGTVNEDKIQKSLVNAEVAYQRYRQKEIELQRKMNEVNRMERGVNAQVQPPRALTPPAEPAKAEPTSFEAQIEADLQKEGAGKVLAKLFDAAKRAAYDQAVSDIQELKMESELSKRQRQLETIAQNDPWVLSEDGFNTLAKIREDKPWLNQSPEPWTSAYREYVADQAMQQRVGSQVTAPTPKRLTAPPAPANPVDRSPKTTVNVNSMDKDQIDAYLNGKSKADQAAIFRSMGLRFPGK